MPSSFGKALTFRFRRAERLPTAGSLSCANTLVISCLCWARGFLRASDFRRRPNGGSDTTVKIPDSLPIEKMKEIFSERPMRSNDQLLNLSDAIAELPFAIYASS